MKVALVLTHLNAGGITTYALTLASALKSKGCSVLLASGGGQFSENAGLEHHNIGIRTKSEIGPKVFWGALKLSLLIREHKINLLHAQTRVAAVTSFLASRMTGVPFMTTAHGFFRPHWGRRIFPCWGETVIAISSQVFEHLRRDFKVNESRIRLIYNGTDYSRFDKPVSRDEKELWLKKNQLRSDIPTIGIVARLSPVKGHRYLLLALKDLKVELAYQCVIVGDGPCRDEVLSDIEKYNLKNEIRWIPWVDDPSEILGFFDIFVLPSLQEGLSLSILEAQAAGVPVVASNVGGISEVVIDHQTGLLVPPKDSQRLKEALKELMLDLGHAREMGRAGREHVKVQFGLDRMSGEVLSLYGDVLKRKNRG